MGSSGLITPDSVHARVVLAAYDSTFLDFSRAATQDSAEQGRLAAGIEGALGLFSGTGIAYTPIVLVPSPAD